MWTPATEVSQARPKFIAQEIKSSRVIRWRSNRAIVFCLTALLAGCAMQESRGIVERIGMCHDLEVIVPVVSEWDGWKKSVHYVNGSNRVSVATIGRECDVLVDGEWWIMSERQAATLRVGQPVVIRH